jgi:SOS-response transcriptional repressors (RecA-mediated autopeptidases)
MGRDVVYLPAKERGKKIIHFKKNYKTMTEDELKELFRTLEEQGWKPQLCDTPVPLYDVRVPCGPPTELGDTPPEVVMMPKDFLFSLQEFMVTVTGDSMVDADIEEGDVVTVEPNTPIHDGDIVLVMIDGETTLKSYCMDEEGQPWLVPQNTAYNAFRLSESNSVWVMGVVRAVEKRAPRVSYRACIKHIAKAKTKMAQPQPLTSEAAKDCTEEETHRQHPAPTSAELTARAVQNALRLMAGKLNTQKMAGMSGQALWQGIYRVLADRGIVKPGDYAGFGRYINALKVEGMRLADEGKGLSKTDDGVLKRPLAEWNLTSYKGRKGTFDRYHLAATTFDETLTECMNK